MTTPQTPDTPQYIVHNHGPEEGPSLACRERVVDGKLRGACLPDHTDYRCAGGCGASVDAEGGFDTCPDCARRI